MNTSFVFSECEGLLLQIYLEVFSKDRVLCVQISKNTIFMNHNTANITTIETPLMLQTYNTFILSGCHMQVHTQKHNTNTIKLGLKYNTYIM